MAVMSIDLDRIERAARAVLESAPTFEENAARAHELEVETPPETIVDLVALARWAHTSGTVSDDDVRALQAIRVVIADAFGHPARDAAIAAIDRLVASSVRREDGAATGTAAQRAAAD
jgi:hypothetical protein